MIPHETTSRTMKPFSWKMRLRSFGFAWAGILRFFRTEPNAQIHLAASMVVLLLSLMFRPPTGECLALILSVALVWSMEMINTAIEKIMDHLSPERHPAVAAIKDIAAGAVLVASAAALLVGLFVFLPKIFAL